MIAEALKLIQDTAVDAAGPQKLPSANPHEERVLVKGDAYIVEKTTPARNHVVYDIDSLSAFVGDLKDVVIWHDDSRVVAVLNDETFRDSRVSMPLPIHPTFAALAKCCGVSYTQRDLIEYLRLNLKNEITAAVPGFIAALRAVKIEQSESGESDIQHGRENMGRKISQSVTGIDALPEDFILQVPLWLHLDAMVQVQCSLIIDTAKATFRCGPNPGAAEQAKVQGQKWLNAQLESACENATVYFGGPDNR